MKVIVIFMTSVKMVFSVDQTIVQIILAFILNLIAVMPQLLEMNIFVQHHLVQKMKVIVTLMMNVKLVCPVDQRIAQLHLALALKLIVAMSQQFVVTWPQ